MPQRFSETRPAWLAAGLLAGLAVAYFWPHEPTYATTADRDAQFAMVTVPVGTNVAGITDAMDGVFVLDFLTGQLMGAVLNRQTGLFTNFYSRDVAKDFQVNPEAEPHYAMVTGYSQLASRQGQTFASGVVYIGELNSGRIGAYAFTWKEAPRPAPQAAVLIPLDSFAWRKPTKKD